MEAFKKKWSDFVQKMNEQGVPVPVVRMNGKASLSATLVIASFTMWAISVIGKAANVLGGMDTASCFNMFMACSALYWGRKFQADGKAVKVDGADAKGDGDSDTKS